MIEPWERDAIQALARCHMLPGSFEKRFARNMAKRLEDPAWELNEKHRDTLRRLAHNYRVQIGRCMVPGCFKCRVRRRA